MKKTLIILLACALGTNVLAANKIYKLGRFLKEHTQRVSMSVSAGGLGSDQISAMGLGGSVCVYGLYADAMFGMFNDGEYLYPFCKQHMRANPILTEYVFGYSFPVMSNVVYQYENGFTLYLTPVYGYFSREFSYVLKGENEFFENHTEKKPTFGIVGTLRWFNGNMISVKATRFGGSFSFGHTLSRSYKKKAQYIQERKRKFNIL